MIIPGLSSRLLQLIVQGQEDGQTVMNIWYIKVHTVSTDPGDGADVLEAFVTAYRADILPLCSEQYWVDYYILKEVAPSIPVDGAWTFSDQLLYVGETADTGSLSGADLPVFACATGRLVATNYSANFRGSKRFSGLMEVDSDAARPNHLTETARIDWQDALILLIDAMDSTTVEMVYEPVVASNLLAQGKDPGNASDLATFTSVLVGGRINGRLGSQVTRKTRRDAY